MKIRRKYQNSASAEINLTALLDVVFSILAFFILVSAALTIPSSVGVDLPIRDRDPKGNASDGLKSSDIFIITLNAKGQMLSNGNIVPDQQLEQAIGQFLANSSQGVVVLTADNTDVSYQVVIERLAQLRKIAGDRVAIATSRS
ncbi:MAG: biopolymer transporter ExbD [Pseudanabaenaceae cyanobacterium bins.39]|nr:biopolymer transporter ExbD [Pseudanabaenaceae cyanobacterium bins.39]